MRDEEKQLNLPQREEKILEFWEAHNIFQETLKKNKKGKRFVFYEGPPTANGLPGIHHVLARAFKDIVLRYKTMRGFFVPRRAGWDTHGLPVEIEVEKMLGFKIKQDIEHFGIAAFNKKAKESVWKYKDEWERFTKRIGFWLDMEHPYVTYDTSYIESLWAIIKKISERKINGASFLYKDFKITPWCPRCETGLSSHEVGQGYKKVKENSLFVKFPVHGEKNEFLLVWTTTPWTLPANVAVAVNSKLEYTKYKIAKEGAVEYVWSAKPPPYREGEEVSVVEKVSGNSLVGKRYTSLYFTDNKVNKFLHVNHEAPPYEIVAADFVSLEEGTGMVHMAPAFGEEDMAVMKEYQKQTFLKKKNEEKNAIKGNTLKLYPILETVLPNGTMKKGVIGEGKFVKDADKDIIEDLTVRKLLFSLLPYEHEYPFCWRCQTPLLYFARQAWWIRMSELREKLLKSNSKINWIPEHIKEGRFGEFLKEVRDWAFSRERFWGTPLPAWECQTCGMQRVIGSIQELSGFLGNTKNEYIIMRHGESESNTGHIAISHKKGYPLTEKGRRSAEKTAKVLAKKKIDMVIASPISRAKETAEIVARVIGKKVFYDARLSEINVGVFDGRDIGDYHRYYKNLADKFSKPSPMGESLRDVRGRMVRVIVDLEKKYSGKRILMVSHEYPIWMLFSAGLGLSEEKTIALRSGNYAKEFIHFAEARTLEYRILPRDEEGMVNLHRPYVDEITCACPRCLQGTMSRVKEVVDGWFDSGSMPYAQSHWPFEKEKLFYPADYICEAVDQTRGWFYTLLAVGTLLSKEAPYKTVISTGHVLDKNGQKMSKSKGNVILPKTVMEKYGADALRWYFYTINLPGEPKRFDEKDLLNKLRNFLGIVWNVFLFFETYVKNAKRKTQSEKRRQKNILDQWVLARANECIREVTEKIDVYDIMGAGRALETFAVSDVSQWYVRRSRHRFQHPDSEEDFDDASQTLGEVLYILVRLLAPFTPFFGEILYQLLRKKMDVKNASVHLEDWPKPSLSKNKNREALVKDMVRIRTFVQEALKLRADAGVKVRQPLKTLVLSDASFHTKKELLSILKDEVNVKEIVFGDAFSLDTLITFELREEGLAREIVRNVQEIRKELGMRHKDSVFLQISGSDRIYDIVRRWESHIKKGAGIKLFRYGGKKIFRAERELFFDSEEFWLGVS